MGWLIKCEAVYDTPFWRADGLNGSAVVNDGPARSVFDVSPPDASRGMLLGFVGGDAAREYSNAPERLRQAGAIESHDLEARDEAVDNGRSDQAAASGHNDVGLVRFHKVLHPPPNRLSSRKAGCTLSATPRRTAGI